MHKAAPLLLSAMCLALALPLATPAAAEDAEGCRDHPLFNRMPGYSIQRCEEQEFEKVTFHSEAAPKDFDVEGRVFNVRYALDEGAKDPGRLKLLRNYENAVKQIGGKVLASDWDGNSYLKVAKDGKEFFVCVSAYITSEWTLTVVEREAMKQDVVADAKAFAGDIRSTGHAAVYGIYFDTNKAVLKPASDAALAEIAKLLKADPELKLNVVGHTDNVGAMDANMKLSQARAAAVVQALTGKHGIAATRLKPYGVSSLSPVAPNGTEEGRAKNRRVELVQQ